MTKNQSKDEVGAGGRNRGRRTRKSQGTRKPVWLYFDADEHELVHIAASIEGDSASNFGAKAVLERAYEVIQRYNQQQTIAEIQAYPSKAKRVLESVRGLRPRK